MSAGILYLTKIVDHSFLVENTLWLPLGDYELTFHVFFPLENDERITSERLLF